MVAALDEPRETILGRRVHASAWVFGPLALAAIALWPTMLSLVRIWGEMADYSHGYIAAVVVVVWLAQLRRKLELIVPRTSWIALSALAVALAAWLIAYRGNSELLQQLLLPLILFLAVMAAAGLRVATLVAVPLAYLYFAIPIWEYAVPFLQKLTAAAAERALAVLNVPASFAGPEVTIPNGKFTITEDCAGKRYLLVGLASAALSGVVQQLPTRRMLVLLAGAAALSLLANWLRVATIIYVGFITDMQHYLIAVEHVTFGWFVFLPFLASIFFLSWRLSRRGAAVTADVVVGSSAQAPGSRIVRLQTAALLFVTLLAGTGTPASTSSQATLDALPILTGAWQGPFPSSGWQPTFTAALDQRQAAYVLGGRAVHVYVNLYESQRQGRELVHYRNSILGVGWSETGSTFVSQLDGAPAAAKLSVVRDESGHAWVLTGFYNVDGLLIATPLMAQLAYGARALLRPVPSGVIALASPCQGDCAAAAKSVRALWRDTHSQLAGMLPTGH